MKLSIKGMWYAKRCHSEVNHYYDGNPYSLHLQMVVDVAHKYLHLIPEGDVERIVAACWAHDVIEDCRQTYNDVKKGIGCDSCRYSIPLYKRKRENPERKG